VGDFIIYKLKDGTFVISNLSQDAPPDNAFIVGSYSTLGDARMALDNAIIPLNGKLKKYEHVFNELVNNGDLKGFIRAFESIQKHYGF
jgi:hypothetical protein